MSDPLDSLDNFLAATPPPSDPSQKDDILGRTLRTMRGRRRWRRAGFVAALAACYAAGALTLHWITPAAEPEVRIVERVVEREVVAVPNPEAPARAIVQPATALALEWQAVENPERRAELFRLAGDRYLTEENDMASAVRCYKKSLNASKADDLNIAPDDNWLLISLKNARQEERDHAKNDG